MENKYLTLCFTKYCMCFSKFVGWGMGEGKKKNLHLIYAFLPSHIELFLLLETLGTNCTKEPSLKAFCGVHHFCNCIMCFFVVLSDKDIKLTNIEEMYALFEM